MKDSQGQDGTAGTALDAAAASMARGASGFWLRAGRGLVGLPRAVYLLVGYLAFRLRSPRTGERARRERRRGRPGGRRSAWGRFALVLLVAGLAAYALTQLVEAVFRPAHATGTMGAWRQRAVSSWGFVLYSVFCVSTARLLAETPREQTAQSEHRQDTGMTAGCCERGWGKAVLVLAGILVVAGGLEAARRAVRLNFRERFTAGRMSRALAVITRALGAFGCTARAADAHGDTPYPTDAVGDYCGGSPSPRSRSARAVSRWSIRSSRSLVTAAVSPRDRLSPRRAALPRGSAARTGQKQAEPKDGHRPHHDAVEEQRAGGAGHVITEHREPLG